MASSAVRSLRVAVVGASVSGLVLARTIQCAGSGFSVKIYDRCPGGLKADGSSLSFLQGAGILYDLGLTRALDQITNRPQVMNVHARGNHLLTVGTGSLTHLVPWPDLHQVLAEAVGESLRFDRDVVAVDEADEEAALTFSDGSCETADLVVLAGGSSNSAIAPSLFGKAELEWSGLQVLLAATAEPIRPDPSQVTVHLDQIGRSGHLLADWTVGSGDASCDEVAIISRKERPPKNTMTAAEAKAELRLLSAQADPLNRIRVGIIDSSHRCAHWPIYHQAARTNWSSAGGRVTLLGNAAHAMPPLSAQAANSAVQDGFRLGHRLVHSSSLAEALRGYESACKTPRERLAHVSRYFAYASTLTGWKSTARDVVFSRYGSRLAREMHRPFVV